MAITIAVNKVSNNISISTDDVVISTAEVVQPITVNTAIPSVVFDSSYLAVTPSGLVTATNVQGAIDQLAAVTEANDLSNAVTWADVPDANITESSVAQHITSANVSAAGAAMLTGADFTGDVTITNGELTVNGSAEADLFKGDIEGAVHFKGAVASGATLAKGDVVYVSGHSGQKTEVDLADASDSSKMPAFGIVAADPVGVNVDVVTFGTLKSINTSSYTDGDELYVSTTAGQLTATAPSGEGNLVQKIAKVVKAHNSGNIKVMGAGRTNATPNLNNGNIFIGDSNNLATTASFATQVADATTGKADLSGATFTGDISVPEITADNAEINGGDLVLRSDSTGADTQFIRFENKNDNSRTSFIEAIYSDDDKGSLTFGTSGLVDNVQTDAKKMLSLYHHGLISMYNKNNARYFTFNEDGRVGIGSGSNIINTRGTSEALNIAGSVRTEGGDLVLEYRNGSQGEVSFTKRDDANNSYRQSYIKPEFFADADDGSGLAFGTAPINASTYSDSITRMFIDAAGNVGINSTQPLEKLDVVGNIAVSGTVDGVDIETLGANAIVDGDFISAGIMTTDGSGGYSVDSSTYATETYVDTAVSGLVDSAPATLDTLNELASALGDDANFSTTVTNSIGTKWTEDATKISNWDTAYSWGDHDAVGYLTAETNNLSTTVTWANVPDANITQSSVTQHQAALSVTESQISDFGTYLTTHQNISGKANLSGATFSGNVSIGTPPSGTQSLLVAGVSNLYGGASVTGNITVTGTVDGRDVATDGARLDTIPYHRVKHTQLRADNQAYALNTSYNNVGLYDTIVHPATPVECARYLDLDIAIKWYYVSSNTNDLYLQLQMIVPTGGGTVTNMGTATQESVNNPEYNGYSNFAWYYVSGDYTHLFTEFGRINTGTGTSEGIITAWKYDSVNNRTYLMTYDNPGVSFNTGDTFYYSPYAFESAGATLTVIKEIDERYVSGGAQPHSFKFKTSYDDAALSYTLKMKEYTTADSGQVLGTTVTFTDVEEL